MADRQATMRRAQDLFDQADAWKQASEEADACFVWEVVIDLHLTLFRVLTELWDRWHAAHLAGEIPHDPANQAGLGDMLRRWVQDAEGEDGALKAIAELERLGYRMGRAEEFREAYRALRAALTPDEEFFEPGKLAALRTEAEAEHGRGETEAWLPADGR